MERETRTSLICIGLDLAWSPRNLSGVATLECQLINGNQGISGQLVDLGLVSSNEEILAYFDTHATHQSVIIAVDAPLLVPNETGMRAAEAELGQVFRRYHAGAHPANRQRLVYDGVVRGEALVSALKPRSVIYDPMIEQAVQTLAQNKPIRQVTEVFPHAAMVSIFNLNRILKYKAKPKRSWEERLQAWQRYQDLCRSLQDSDPPLQGHEAFICQDVSILRGQKLKDYEDQMDALMCAYIALYGVRWGSLRCRAFGSVETGSIFTPVPSSI